MNIKFVIKPSERIILKTSVFTETRDYPEQNEMWVRQTIQVPNSVYEKFCEEYAADTKAKDWDNAEGVVESVKYEGQTPEGKHRYTYKLCFYLYK